MALIQKVAKYATEEEEDVVLQYYLAESEYGIALMACETGPKGRKYHRILEIRYGRICRAVDIKPLHDIVEKEWSLTYPMHLMEHGMNIAQNKE